MKAKLVNWLPWIGDEYLLRAMQGYGLTKHICTRAPIQYARQTLGQDVTEGDETRPEERCSRF